MKEVPKYLFVSNRDITVASTQGYAIEFKKGEPTHVPRSMHNEVMEKGVIPCDDAGALRAAEPAPVAKVLLAPEDADERAEAIRAVMAQIVERNNSHDFSAGGVPSSSSVSAALG